MPFSRLFELKKKKRKTYNFKLNEMFDCIKKW